MPRDWQCIPGCMCFFAMPMPKAHGMPPICGLGSRTRCPCSRTADLGLDIPLAARKLAVAALQPANVSHSTCQQHCSDDERQANSKDKASPPGELRAICTAPMCKDQQGCSITRHADLLYCGAYLHWAPWRKKHAREGSHVQVRLIVARSTPIT
jgi:hypothetical protein